jgi:phage portal protein BeeE
MNQIYERNDLIRAIVDTKVRQIVSIDWGVEKADPDGFAPMGLARKLEQFLREPNVDETWTDLAMQWLRDLFVLDAAPLEIVRDRSTQLPVELVARDGATVIPIVDDHGRLTKYQQLVQTQGAGEKTVDFPGKDVVYLKSSPSTNRVLGLSPLESLAVTIGADIHAMSYNARFFTDGYLMENILILGRLGAQALDDTKGFFDENRGKHVLPIISDLEKPEGAQLLRFRDTNKDMEFLGFERWIFQRACAVYQVSASQIILLDPLATKAAGQQEQDTHSMKSLKPELQMIEARLTRGVIREFHPNLAFRFQTNEKIDQEKEARTWQIQFQSGRPLNELREQNGLHPIEGPDVDLGDGRTANAYDLPMNPTTGRVLGVQSGGGEFGPGGFGDLFASRQRRGPKGSRGAKARKRPGRGRSTDQVRRERAFAAYEARRAELARSAPAGLRDDGRARHGSLARAIPEAVPGTNGDCR